MRVPTYSFENPGSVQNDSGLEANASKDPGSFLASKPELSYTKFPSFFKDSWNHCPVQDRSTSGMEVETRL